MSLGSAVGVTEGTIVLGGLVGLNVGLAKVEGSVVVGLLVSGEAVLGPPATGAPVDGVDVTGAAVVGEELGETYILMVFINIALNSYCLKLIMMMMMNTMMLLLLRL